MNTAGLIQKFLPPFYLLLPAFFFLPPKAACLAAATPLVLFQNKIQWKREQEMR
jgi:hypothetical protein